MNPATDAVPCGVCFVGRRGFRERGAASAAQKSRAIYSIEGEALTTDEIAARLGLSESGARKRLRLAQQQADRVTWEGLRA